MLFDVENKVVGVNTSGKTSKPEQAEVSGTKNEPLVVPPVGGPNCVLREVFVNDVNGKPKTILAWVSKSV
jgi:hypothetical protein